MIPGFDGASSTHEWKEALWAEQPKGPAMRSIVGKAAEGRFYMGAPERQRSSVERYSGVKRA